MVEAGKKSSFAFVSGKFKEIGGKVWLIEDIEDGTDKRFKEELRCLGVSRVSHKNFGVLKVNEVSE